MERSILRKVPFPLLIVLVLFFISIGWRLEQRIETRPAAPVQLRGSGEVLTLAATGDTLLQGGLPSTWFDRGFAGAVEVIQKADLGLTNLDEVLLDPSRILPSEPPGIIRWPYGTKSEAVDLRHAGFNMVSLANNHGADYSETGIQQTIQILDHEGLLHAGAGSDLTQARMPVFAGAAPRRVAMLAVTISAAAESRATYTHGEIKGRPGVDALKYAVDVTVDPSDFATLEKLAARVQPDPKAESSSFTLFGTVIKKGLQTSVDFVPDEQDMSDVIARIKDARSKANALIVMLHSHEPGNNSQIPADFVQRFAHAAIEAGATMVIGHGPHQLRGIEIYNGGAILYSLGNFVFDYSVVDPRSVDAYDGGADLYRLAMDSLTESQKPPSPRFEEPVWWESVIAVARIDHGGLRSIQLQPIDLGADLPLEKRGTPRIASSERGHEILQRLARLSNAFGTQVRVENGVGIIDVGEH